MKKTKSARHFEPIPPFKNYEEEANFWDSHDAIADVDEGTLVGFHKANKSGILTVRFEEEDLRTIRAKAFKKGIGPTTLIRMWVKEHLQGGNI